MKNIYRDWTVTVTQRIEDNKNKGAWIIDVSAVNGDTTEIRNFHGIVSQAMLESAIKGWIDNIESAKSVTESIDLTEKTPEPTPEKTQAEIEKEAWEKDWAKLNTIQPYITAGVFTGNETPIVNLRNKVRDTFKLEYLGL